MTIENTIEFSDQTRCYKCRARAAVFHNGKYFCGECWLARPRLDSPPTKIVPKIDEMTVADIVLRG